MEISEWISGIISALRALFAWRKHPPTGAHQSLRAGDASHNVQIGGNVGGNINITASPDRPSASSRILAELDRSMSDLFNDFRNDLRQEPFVRDFFVVPSRESVFGFLSHKCFAFYEDEIPDLIGKVHILEGHRLVRDVTPGNTPLYRMTEEFVAYLTAQG